ncbi:MAG TPA: hypothetical protein VF549_07030 [Solirubrobacteraceae bacterium]|jgi:hypothetical protein
MDDMLDELQTTAERVERFRAIHEDAVRDLREKIAAARAAGCDHDEIDGRLREARDSVRRFVRMRRATDFLGTTEREGGPEDRADSSTRAA